MEVLLGLLPLPLSLARRRSHVNREHGGVDVELGNRRMKTHARSDAVPCP